MKDRIEQKVWLDVLFSLLISHSRFILNRFHDKLTMTVVIRIYCIWNTNLFSHMQIHLLLRRKWDDTNSGFVQLWRWVGCVKSHVYFHTAICSCLWWHHCLICSISVKIPWIRVYFSLSPYQVHYQTND